MPTEPDRITVLLLPDEVLALVKYIEPALTRMNLTPGSPLVTAHEVLSLSLLAWEERPH